MYAYAVSRAVGIVWISAFLVVVVVTPLHAQDTAPEQTWTGQSIQQASENWADYAVGPTVAHTERSWTGQSIQQASENWADYAVGPTVAHTERSWAGQNIQQASENWADYASQPAVVAKP